MIPVSDFAPDNASYIADMIHLLLHYHMLPVTYESLAILAELDPPYLSNVLPEVLCELCKVVPDWQSCWHTT